MPRKNLKQMKKIIKRLEYKKKMFQFKCVWET